MKINFTRQFSDGIHKQNHELRTNIVLIKQQLQNFQDSMVAFIRQSQVQVQIAKTPQQTLTLFMQTVSSRIAEYQMRIKKQEVNTKSLNKTKDQLQVQNQQFKKQRMQSEKRQIKLKQEMDTIQKRYYDLVRKFSQYQLQQQTLKQEIKSINQKSIIERSIHEQIKKKQFEVAKLKYHQQYVSLREKIEQQNLQLQKKYKTQIAEKEKRIKQLEKLAESLAISIKDSAKTDIMSPTIQLFQQSNRSRKTIDDLKQQNAQMKKTLNNLQRKKLELSSKIMEKNIELHKLQTQFEQQKVEKLEFEKKLAAKTKQIQKSQKDKHVTEEYYEKKWNSDYKKVKAQLEKSFLQKNQEFQKSFALRVQQFQAEVIEWLQKVNAYERKNKQLERIHNSDTNEKQILKKEIDKLLIQKQTLNSQLTQTWRMSREEILGLKVKQLQQQKIYNQQIRLLSKDLEKQQSHLEIQSQQIEYKIKGLQEKHLVQLQKQLEQQKKKHKIQIETLLGNYEGKIAKLKEQIHLQTIKVEKVKQEITQQFQKQTQIIKQRHQKQIKQKEDDLQKKLEKAMHKLKDYQHKTVSTKKQHEETLLTVEKQKKELQKSIQDLKTRLKNTEIELKLGNGDKKQIIELNSQLKKKICSLEQTIQNKNKQIWDTKMKQKKDQDIAQQLTRKRDQWVNQLIELQRTYQKDFEQLKNIFNRQTNIYKSKIWQLERQYKNQSISKKNYDRMLSLHSKKEQLKNALEIKEAENIVLSQVNQMYETQLRMSQEKFNKTQFKEPSAIFMRKLDRHRKFTQVKITNKNNTDSKDIVKMKKYIRNSYKKQQYMSLAKAGYKQVPDYQRLKTSPV